MVGTASFICEHEAGAKAADRARKHGVSEATLYNWKAKPGGLDVSPHPIRFTKPWFIKSH